MKLEYDLVEDQYDDTTQLRTMTEEAVTPWGGRLLRTTVYSPHNMSTCVTYIPAGEASKSGFEAVVP
ncbi:MAG: hypothetical protein OEQ18_17235 [Gammaproteobacteria bacterium]|nr:hypothetical protein [Gammaproteobacteria bacterium]